MANGTGVKVPAKTLSDDVNGAKGTHTSGQELHDLSLVVQMRGFVHPETTVVGWRRQEKHQRESPLLCWLRLVKRWRKRPCVRLRACYQ